MKHFSLAASIAVLAALAAPARAEVTVIDNHRVLDVDCAKDPDIAVVGNHITLTTHGVCAKITVLGNHANVTASSSEVSVAGNHNTLALTAADQVTVAGNHNTVSVRKALTLKSPRIANLGNDNRVTQPR
jgi:hypothetical protein